MQRIAELLFLQKTKHTNIRGCNFFFLFDDLVIKVFGCQKYHLCYFGSLNWKHCKEKQQSEYHSRSRKGKKWLDFPIHTVLVWKCLYLSLLVCLEGEFHFKSWNKGDTLQIFKMLKYRSDSKCMRGRGKQKKTFKIKITKVSRRGHSG